MLDCNVRKWSTSITFITINTVVLHKAKTKTNSFRLAQRKGMPRFFVCFFHLIYHCPIFSLDCKHDKSTVQRRLKSMDILLTRPILTPPTPNNGEQPRQHELHCSFTYCVSSSSLPLRHGCYFFPLSLSSCVHNA